MTLAVSRNDFVRLPDSPGGEYRRYVCPFDGDEIRVQKDVFYGYCETCGITYMDYIPEKHQEAFHESNAKIRLNLGGYGSGKTTMSCAEIAEHILTVDNGRTIIVAVTLDQFRRTVLNELKKFIDLSREGKFVERHTRSPLEWTFKNGHELFVMASDDDEKLRSLNVTAFYMEEASGIDVKIFHQLNARLRNTAGLLYDEDGNEIGSRLMGIITSNPEDGWLVDDVLKYCNHIYITPQVPRLTLESMERDKNKDYEAFMSSTRDNLKHLPKSFISTLAQGKSPQWIAKYIDCDIATREGLVYPGWTDALMSEEVPIPSHWYRIVGYDSGFRDPTAIIYGAINPTNGDIYLYKEYYERHKILSEHARAVNEELKDLDLLLPIQADPNMFNKTVRTGRSDGDYFQSLVEHIVEPGKNKIQPGIEKVRDYLSSGKIKIFPSLSNLREEFRQFIYKPHLANEKTIDEWDHLMDALRYMIAPLPDNPHELNESYVNLHAYSELTVDRGDMMDDSITQHVEFGFDGKHDKGLKESREGAVYYEDNQFWRR